MLAALAPILGAGGGSIRAHRETIGVELEPWARRALARTYCLTPYRRRATGPRVADSRLT